MAGEESVLASAAMTGNPYLSMGDMALKNVAGGSAGPSAANNKQEAAFDSSGWNVTFGNGDIAATTDKNTGGVATMASYAPYIAFTVGAIVLWKMFKKS